MTMKDSPDRQRFIAEYRRFLRNALRESSSMLLGLGKPPEQSQQIQPKEITMTQCQPIETAPIECFGSSEEENPEILVYSRWDWGGMDREECSLEYSWRVAEYEDGHFWSVTSNPYRDKAFNPTHWMPLPPPPAIIEKGE